MQITNQLWALAVVYSLYNLGIRHFCVAPGSRSAPLAIAVFHLRSRFAGITLHTHFDERGLGFFALNLAKAIDSPCAIITTSGTAVANVLPAVIEAFETSVPLIVLAADRPDRLLECGANQAIRQKCLFGENVLAYRNFCVPETPAGVTEQIRCIQGVFPRAPQLGPISFNFQFDEPLYENKKSENKQYENKQEQLLKSILNLVDNTATYKRNPLPKTDSGWNVDEKELAAVFASQQKCLVILGALSPKQYTSLAPWLNSLRCPIVADISSQSRLLTGENIIHYADLILASEQYHGLLDADLILQFGGRLVSKRLGNYLAQRVENAVDYYIIQENNRNLDPTRQAKKWVINFSTFVKKMIDLRLSAKNVNLQWLQLANKHLAGVVEQAVSSGWNEAVVCKRVVDKIQKNTAVFCGNSLAIRMLDSYSAGLDVEQVALFSNRGASGIDGLVASALGAAQGGFDQCVLFIGDTSLLHDLNSLALVAKSAVPIKIIILNNNGGAIFNMLPAAQEPAFNELFLMPQHLNFSSAAMQFGIEYFKVADQTTLAETLEQVFNSSHSVMVECVIPHPEGVEQIKKIVVNIRNLGKAASATH